jgi:voltage-gated potassium channel
MVPANATQPVPDLSSSYVPSSGTVVIPLPFLVGLRQIVVARGVSDAHPDGVSGADGGLARTVPNGLPMESTPAGRFFRFVLRKPLTPGRAGRAIALATMLVTVACGVLIRILDPSDFANVGQGMWWAVQTVTTVGYGDKVPRHPGGRIVAAVLMLVGIGFLTVVTASITAALIETVRRRLGDPIEERLEAKVDEMNARLQRLEEALGRARE